MAATFAGSLDYNTATIASTHSRTVPAFATSGRRCLVTAVVGSGARVITATLTHADATTRNLPQLGVDADISGHASTLWEFLADSKTAGATLTLKCFASDGVTASSERVSISLVVLDGVGAPHAFASVEITAAGTTKTVPQVTPTISDTVAVCIAADTEGGASPTTPTTAWTVPSGTTLLADDYPPTTGTPVPTHAVAGALGSPIAVNTASPAYVFTADNSAIGSAWTILYPVLAVLDNSPTVAPAVVATTRSNSATAAITHPITVPAAATIGRRIAVGLTYASGARVATATLVHADGTTRDVPEIAPKAALTNGGHAQHVFEVACDGKTGGARLDLAIAHADGTAATNIKASIVLAVLEGVGAPVAAVTAPHNSGSTTKTTPTATPTQSDTVELTLVSDSRGGTSPITSTSAWTAPEGFTLAVADFMAGTTDSPVSTSALAHRFGTRLPADQPAGGRVWTANVSNVGASWTLLYPAANASGFYAAVADGFVSLALLFPDTLTTPAAPVQASPATAITATGFTSSWSAAASADTYRVQRRTGTNAFATVATVSTTSYSHSGLTASTAYDVRIIGVNSGTVQGPASNTVSTTTAAA